MDLYNVINRPLVTEKSLASQADANRYVFEVNREATKLDVKKAVEKLFKVNVLDVNTLITRGKFKRVGQSMGKRSNYKKAFVTIKAGQKIEVFEGV
ncbi:50S ribosomal protein L23 [bacterium]|nr:50S ribosomal protein L23 [bacterium]